MPRLECKICVQEYKINNENLTPKILPTCGHTICEKCAETLARGNQFEGIECPFDRRLSYFEQNVRQLPKNFAILEFLEELRQESGDSPQTEPEVSDLADNDANVEEQQEEAHREIDREQHQIHIPYIFNEADGMDDDEFDMYLNDYNNRQLWFRPQSPDPDSDYEPFPDVDDAGEVEYDDDAIPVENIDFINAFFNINLGN